jgi:hypothetical protein
MPPAPPSTPARWDVRLLHGPIARGPRYAFALTAAPAPADSGAWASRLQESEDLFAAFEQRRALTCLFVDVEAGARTVTGVFGSAGGGRESGLFFSAPVAGPRR